MSVAPQSYLFIYSNSPQLGSDFLNACLERILSLRALVLIELLGPQIQPLFLITSSHTELASAPKPHSSVPCLDYTQGEVVPALHSSTVNFAPPLDS